MAGLSTSASVAQGLIPKYQTMLASNESSFEIEWYEHTNIGWS
jgi:hypothetical protein